MTATMPRFFGVDLAWGQRNRTGLAVLDDRGRLLESATVRPDEAILSFVRKHATGTTVAAIDAPMIVPNETGGRACDALVDRLFGSSWAGAYPANRANPLFFPEPRGAVLARALGWQLDPAMRPCPGRQLCIEVYPHPAMVVLFGLSRVIPYKIKQGRDLASLLRAYDVLLGHLEATCGPTLHLAASSRWQLLRSVAATATRKSELAAIEDEVDAIFCAYLAWMWANAPERMAVLGDLAGGYIVVPAPPSAATVPTRVSR